jgi:putative membrane protein
VPSSRRRELLRRFRGPSGIIRRRLLVNHLQGETMRLLLNWLLSAIALLIVSYLVPGFHIEGFKAALIAAVVIGLINATLGLLLKVITLPLTLLTLGVFWWVVNALMLMLASKLLAPGFMVSGFFAAFLGAIVLSLVNMVLRKVAGEVTD